MYEDYYGPGSEEYDRDMYEEHQREYAEWQQEYEQYKWEEEQKQQIYDSEKALQDTLDDAARENCYADYSSGKKPEMNCEYSTESSSSAHPNQENIATCIFLIIIAIAIVAYFVYRLSKNKNHTSFKI